jgi:iron complex transport system ATP-binding protein
MSGPETIALEAQQLTFSYARPVVRDFSLTLKPGTVTGILGPNGCGKTTVLRLLDGILRPAQGRVLLQGSADLSRLSRKEIARRIALVPQNGGLYQPLTVFEFAMLGRSPHLPFLGFETAEDEKITLHSLEVTQLSAFRDARIYEISGGEKQRLLLARALSQETPILLLDEFTANLDVNYQIELMALVRRITQTKRIATLIVSHEIGMLATFSDFLVMMRDGMVRHYGRVSEVITRENLRELFGVEFSIHFTPDGTPEILPIVRTRISK